MAPEGGPIARDLTAALRQRSVPALEAAFLRHVARESTKAHWDDRDEMLSLAAFVDCARRLGQDPTTLLGPLAVSGADWLRETVDAFLRRDDVTLEAFGWTVAEMPDGPAYRFAWPRWTPPPPPRRLASD